MPADPTPSVCVIIVSWNALDILKKCLPSVVDTDYPRLEIVLADNGSTDGSAQWVSSQFPSVRVIRHPDNWGFCRGNNEAIRQTQSDWVVLLNNDVEVDPGWLWPLIRRGETAPEIAAIQPKLLDYHRRSHFEYAGAAGGHLDRLGYPFARGRVFSELEEDSGQYDESVDIFWASGAAVALRRRALDEVGLLDEAFEFHMEEIDLCWRLRSAGYRVVFEPASRVFHMGGGSLAQGNPRKTLYNFRNSLLMLYKNLPLTGWLKLFPQRLTLDAAAALRFLLSGELGNALAVPRAYWQAHWMKSRCETPGRNQSAPPSFRRSIVWKHWVSGVQRFSDLARDDFEAPYQSGG